MHSPNFNTLFFSLIVCLTSCTKNTPDLNGTWYITEMRFQGKPTYPNTTTKNLRTLLENQQDVEALSFRIVDSTAVLPGFYSEKGYASFSVNGNQLTIIPIEDKTPSELTSLMFGGTYEISYSASEQRLELHSADTYLLLIHRDEVLSKNIDNLFE